MSPATPSLSTFDYDLNWHYAYSKPEIEADFRTENEDFQVDEELGFEPCGSGEHVYLHLRKNGDNTQWLAKTIARVAGVKNFDVGLCGQKDRHAITTQWFSVYLPKGPEPDWSELNTETTDLLQVTRHSQKLRRGMHECNHFNVRLRNIDGDTSQLPQVLDRIKENGVPNYFGEQRFGRDGGNLTQAEGLLVERRAIKNRQVRGMVMSAARSYLFNHVLSARVRDGSWLKKLEGELTLNDASTGPLWGRGRLATSSECLALEQNILQPMQSWCGGLEHVGLSQERRMLCLVPQNFTYALDNAELTLSFSLPPGTYATALLREICQLKNLSYSKDVV